MLPRMTWLGWLGVVVLIVAVAAVTGLKPKGTRHVARTRLMGGARARTLRHRHHRSLSRVPCTFRRLALVRHAVHWEVAMAVNVQKNMGFLVLAVWLILFGLTGLVSFALPAPLMAILALIAGILILVGR